MGEPARILRALLALSVLEPAPVTGCPICGGTTKRDSGECDACGVYVCDDCGRLHLGEVRPCPGGGVPVPGDGGDRGE